MVIGLVVGASGVAAEDWDLDDFGPPPFLFSGRAKVLGIGYEIPESVLGEGSTEGSGSASLRLMMEGDPRDWFGYEVHFQVGYDVFSTALLAALPGETPATLFRGLDLESTWSESDHALLGGQLDCVNVQFRFDRLDIVVGRQAVTFGRSFFWNPTDWLATFSPTEIDREYKAGIDGVRMTLGIGRFSGVEILYGYGEDGKRDESALMARVFGNWHDWDLEILGGSVWIDDRLGFAFSGDVAGAGLRGELSWHHPRVGAERDFVRATLELDYRWENSLHLMGELHYNGFGSTRSEEYLGLMTSPRVLTGQVSNVGRDYLGSQLSYEFTPLITGTMAVLGNLHDGSGLVNPSLTISLGDESDLTAGAILPWGADQEGFEIRSEYGTYFTTLWLQWRWSF